MQVMEDEQNLHPDIAHLRRALERQPPHLLYGVAARLQKRAERHGGAVAHGAWEAELAADERVAGWIA
jgi:hypothetical protein